MGPHLESDLKPLFDEKCAVISGWIDQGKIAALDPQHLIFSIWATTQHYADFEAQVSVLLEKEAANRQRASNHLRALFGWVVQLAYSVCTTLPVRGSVVPGVIASIVMQFSTGQTLTHKLHATHSSSITLKVRSSDMAIAWCEVSSHAAKQRPHEIHKSWLIFALAM